MKEELESLVGMMVERGILLEEAITEFEKKFIRRVLEHSRGNQCRAAKTPGNPPQYPEPQNHASIILDHPIRRR